MSRLALPSVTLCAVTSVNVAATIFALQESMREADFGEVVLFTSAADVMVPSEIRVVQIDRLASAADYSKFLLRQLAHFIDTEHCLIVQWDGFVVNAAQWDPSFLEFDYIGATWPQFDDGRNVGNGGFSLRSRKLLQACLDPRFEMGHPEDTVICRSNRQFLEQVHGIRFADSATADRFSYERAVPKDSTFGFHGIFNMIAAIGAERFWQIYATLDDRKTAFVDYRRLMSELGSGPRAMMKRVKFTVDGLRFALMRSSA